MKTVPYTATQIVRQCERAADGRYMLDCYSETPPSDVSVRVAAHIGMLLDYSEDSNQLWLVHQSHEVTMDTVDPSAPGFRDYTDRIGVYWIDSDQYKPFGAIQYIGCEDEGDQSYDYSN